jgi:fructose-1,6-bisphosphatase/sedoheptulose 1,7-bisphosphatase-like protein
MKEEVNMTYTTLAIKLIGRIHPVGESHIDAERFENLKQMCTLVENLVYEIACVAQDKDRHENSIKTAGEYASDFLINTLGIKE